MAIRVGRMRMHLAKCKTVEHVQEERKFYANEKQSVNGN